MVDADTITTLRRLLGEAKLGPLRVEKRDDDSGGIDYPVYADDGDVCICFEHDKYAQRARIYANLIAAAINALPALLDAVEGCVGCGMRGPVEAVERLLEVEAERDAAIKDRDAACIEVDRLLKEQAHEERNYREACAARDDAIARADAAEQSLLALRVELWDGVKAHGLRAPTEYRERGEGARLIHAYCGGIAEARNERDAAIARAADLDKRLTDLAPFLHAMCERAGRAEKALRELQRDELPTNCQHCGGVGAEPPGCPESGPCEQCGGWTTHKRLVAAQAATERARVAEEIAAWHDAQAAEWFSKASVASLAAHIASAQHIRATYCKEPTP